MRRIWAWLPVVAAVATASPGSYAGRVTDTSAAGIQRQQQQQPPSLAAAAAAAGRQRRDADTQPAAGPLICFQVQSPVLLPQGAVVGDRLVGMPSTGNGIPSCEVVLMSGHRFGNSYGRPFSARYEPPPGCGRFTRVVLNLTVTSEGRQFDRLAAFYLGDHEVWRTSTAEPKADPGISWTYLKEATAYLSLWRQPQMAVFDLENIVNDKYTGPFIATLTATFIDDKIQGPGAPPADVIIPISARRGASGMPSAFHYPGDEASVSVALPIENVVRAVVSVAANGQADEEFWWANVPEAATGAFNTTSTGQLPGHSSFREVQLYIDGKLAGLAWPFPVVFTGGVAPPLHRPVVGLQAFDIREQEIDITPWLGLVGDGKPHTYMFRVVDEANLVVPAFWVLSGKIFVWLDDSGIVPLHRGNVVYPEVQVSKPNYEASIPSSSDGLSLLYTQTIRRVYSATSTVVRNGRPHPVSWHQTFSMHNEGFLTDQGNFQKVRAIYTGQDTALNNGATTFHAAYSYPIDMTLNTTGPTRDHALHISAQLYQGLELTITGATAFSTGLEPFVHKLPSSPAASGSTTSTFRSGAAELYQLNDGGSIIGKGQTHQVFRFGATNNFGPTGLGPTDGGDFAFAPLLYMRELTVEDEVITEDKEFVYKEDTFPQTPPHNNNNNKVVAQAQIHDNFAEFAPLPAKLRRGGLKVFFRADVAHEAAEIWYKGFEKESLGETQTSKLKLT